jgi:EAL domain-containing protein (putative c-di-GMP-specific phosphodiesterase class I)/GGDEF domain-containing protein
VKTIRIFQWIEKKRFIFRIVTTLVTLLLLAVIYLFVYMTGGIKFVFSHSMYLPILLSGCVFGIKGGVVVGMIAGGVLGPFMPIDVATGEMQTTTNWLYRTGFFVLVGFFSGAASDGARKYIEHLKWISRHDSATGLPNQRALFEKLTEIQGKEPSSRLFTLSAICQENATELKAAFGFGVIEESIRQLARRIETLSGEKYLFRTESTQLCVLIITQNNRESEHLLNEIIEATREPVCYNKIAIHVDTRMGVNTFSQMIKNPEKYLQEAESALTVARQKAQDKVIYHPKLLTVTEENLSILGELKDAILKKHLSLHYQPKIHLPTGQVRGVEALMRWQHPERGNIPPGAFIPRAEQSTLIQMVTEFALEQAIEQIVQWQENHIDIPVAVNISTRNLLHPGFAGFVFQLLDRYGVNGESLELEVTEGALMMDMERTIIELVKLAGLKIIISIDDFGTGYSSLQYLHQLPASLIKIDQSFVRRLPDDKGAVAIIKAAVMLAQNMGIKVIAEGVETREIYDYLAGIGCDMVQGYFVSRPLPPKDFEKWHAQCKGIFL